MNILRPTYEQIAESLNAAADWISPAELHGLLVGTFCAKGTDLPEDILLTNLKITDQKNPMNLSQQMLFNALLACTREDLLTFNFSIELLLPETDDIYLRANEFIHWCQGFVIGFGTLSEHSLHDVDAIDALKRIVEASHIELSELDVSADDEVYLFDVTEYVRLAVLTIYADLKKTHGGNNSADPSTIYH